jgi:flavin-dependent dehydrogenase
MAYEAVPAALLALLIEFGVVPPFAGSWGTERWRRVGWSQPSPELVRSQTYAVVARPTVELALREAVVRGHSLEVRKMLPTTKLERNSASAGWVVDGRQFDFLVDASGRAAWSVRSTIRPPVLWRVQSWMCTSRRPRSRTCLEIAAFNDGYAFRLSNGASDHVGLVNANRQRFSWHQVQGMMREAGASWLCNDLRDAVTTPARPGIASAQGTADPPESDLLRVGDAAWVHDAVSSQGLAASLSQALYAAAAIDGGPLSVASFHRHQAHQWRVHLAHLRLFWGSHFSPGESIGRYLNWLDEQLASGPLVSPVRLRDGVLL